MAGSLLNVRRVFRLTNLLMFCTWCRPLQICHFCFILSRRYSTRSKWTTSPSNQTTTLNATGELVAAGHAPTTDAPTLSGEVRFSSNVRDDIQENDIFYQFLNIFEIEEIKSTDETTDLQSTSHSSVVTKESYRVTSSTFESGKLVVEIFC